MKQLYGEVLSLLDNKKTLSRKDRLFIKVFIKDLMERLEKQK